MALLVSSSVRAADFIYFKDATAGNLIKADLDGLNPATLQSYSGQIGLTAAESVVVDAANDRLYYNRVFNDTNRGLYLTTLAGGAGTRISPTGNNLISGVCVDTVNGKLYFHDDTAGIWYRSNPDGSSPAGLLSIASSGCYAAVDPAHNTIYFTRRVNDSNRGLWKADLSMSGAVRISSGTNDITGVAVDSAGGFVYYFDGATAQIIRANLDGSSPSALTTLTGQVLVPITLDLKNQRAYYSQPFNNSNRGLYRTTDLTFSSATRISSGTNLISQIATTAQAAAAPAPVVTNVTSSTPNGAYNAPDPVSIQITFDSSVTVTGTPTLALNSGGSATYASGSPGTTLTFNYTVGAGQNAADLDYAATNSLALAGGTINATTGGTAATLTLPATGGAGSLGGNKAIIIDTTAPTINIGSPSVSSINAGAGSVTYTVTYADTNFNASTLANGNITLNSTGNANATVGVSGSGTTRTVTLSSITGAGTLGITIASGTASDTAGNTAPSAGPSTTFAVTAPTPPDYAITTSAGVLTITDSSGNADTLSITEPSAGNILFTVAGRTFSLNGAANTTNDSGNISLSGITSIVVNAAGGSDTITLGNFTAANYAFTMDGGTGTNGLEMAGSFGISTFNLSGIGAGTLNLSATKTIGLTNMASVDVSNASLGAVTVNIDSAGTVNSNIITTIASADFGLDTLATFSVALPSVKIGVISSVLTFNGSNAAGGNDYFLLQGLGTSMLGDFVVDGQGGNADVVDINDTTITVSGLNKDFSAKADFVGLGRQSTAFLVGNLVCNGDITLEADGDSTVVTPLWGAGGVWGASRPVYFNSASIAAERGSVAVGGAISKISGADATCTIKAKAVVLLPLFGNIISTSNKLHVVLNADTDATSGGAVSIAQQNIIRSNGGNITVGGGADPATTPAIGSTTGGNLNSGVTISASEITSAGGNISIRGTGRAVANGVGVNIAAQQLNGASVINSGTGTLTVVGTGGAAASGAAGVRISGSANGSAPGDGAAFYSAKLLSSTGPINITGIGGATGNNIGITALNWTEITSSGVANITLTGTGTGTAAGVSLAPAASVSTHLGNLTSTSSISSAGGDVTLIADMMALNAGTGTESITTGSSTSGTVTLKSLSFAKDILLGSGVVDSSLALAIDSSTELPIITAGTVMIGDTTNTNTLAVSSVISPTTFTTLGLASAGPVTFSATSGFTADVTTASNYEKITAFGGVSITNGATFTVNAAGGYIWNGTDAFTFLANDSTDAILGTFDGPTLTSFLGSALTAAKSYTGGTGNDFVIGAPAPSPTITVSPSSLALGTTTTGTASTPAQSFTVSGSNLTVDIVITPPANVELSKDSGVTWLTSQTLTQSGGTVGTTTILARIRAAASAGPVSGNITSASTGATTQNVSVTGTVNPQAPEMNVIGNSLSIADEDITPASNDGTIFPNAMVGGSSTRVFTIQNAGTATLNVSAITFSGTNGADFSVSPPPPYAIPASGSQNITVQFAPGASGLRTALMNFANDDSDENPYNIGVQGTGVPAPTVTASTANLLATATSLTITGTNFDSVTPGNNTVVFTPAGSGTVTAATPTSLTVTSVTGLRGGNLNAVVTNGGGSSGAAVQVATVTPVVTSSTVTIDSATTSLVINGFGFNPTAGNNSVVFSPAGTGTVTAATATSLTVTSITGLTAGALNAVVTTNTVSSGAAVQVATVVPATTNFMIQPTAVLAAPYDGGPGFAPSDAISKTGLSAPYSSGITSFETYMAGSPTHTGSNVPSNYYGNGPSTLSGPQNIDFDLGATYSLNKVAFWNFPFNTNGPITSLQVYTSTDSAFTAPVLVGTFNPLNNGGFSAIAPVAGQTFLLTNSNARYVRLRVLAYIGGHVGFSEIAFGGISGAPEIAVSGNSVDIADGDAIPSTADNTDFGSTPVQGGVVENTYTITNSGTTNLTLSGGPNFVSVDNAAFSVTLQPSGTIAPAGTTTFKIAFNPTAQGSAPAVVSFTNNDGNESPFDFAIIGIGTGPQTFDLAGNPVSNTPFDGGDTYIYSAGPPPPQPINSAVGDVVSGGGAPDATGADSGADFDVLKRGGFLSQNGTLVFPGNLLVGFGTPPVTLNDFQGIWKDNGTGLKLIARTGTIAPGTTTDTFNGLPNVPAISDNGDVTILGALTVAGATTVNNDTGLWTQVGSGTTPSTFKLLAREGSVVPGTSAVVRKFASGAYATASLSSTQGVVAYSVTTVGSPDKTAIYSTTVDNGVPTSSTALAIEGNPAPGVAGQNFGALASSYSDPARMDTAGNVAFAAILRPSNKESLWYAPYSTGVATKIFFAGDVAPDTGGATFLNLKSQAMGAAGIVTFRGLLTSNTGDNTGNLKNDGIWRGTGSNVASYTCILRRGDSNATRPGLNLPNAADKVGNLWHSWLTNANHGAWVGQLDAGGDGTSVPAPGDTYGIYTDLSGTMTLYMLYGDPAPGIPGAVMDTVDLPIVGGQEQMVFIGKVTGGGVTAGVNDQGIWRSAPNGGALSLLIRTGDSMTTTAGVKTIAKVDFPGSGSKARQWEQPVMDSTGRVLIFVTFIDGSTSQVIAP